MGEFLILLENIEDFIASLRNWVNSYFLVLGHCWRVLFFLPHPSFVLKEKRCIDSETANVNSLHGMSSLNSAVCSKSNSLSFCFICPSAAQQQNAIKSFLLALFLLLCLLYVTRYIATRFIFIQQTIVSQPAALQVTTNKIKVKWERNRRHRILLCMIVFSSAGLEPRRMLQPIEGYKNKPLVSLEQAIEPVVKFCPDIRRRAYVAKERCSHPQDELSQDESASIHLYTMDWEPKTSNVSFVVLEWYLTTRESRCTDTMVSLSQTDPYGSRQTCLPIG